MKRASVAVILGLLALTLAACGGGVPDVTPTVAPTNTPDATRIAQDATATRTPIVIFTATTRPTQTAQPSATPLPPSDTPEPTITDTPLPPSPTRLIRTATPIPTLTHTPTDTPTQRPSITPSLTPTFTDTPTPTPTATNTPDLAATADAILALTRAASSPTPVRATFTAVPQASPTNTLMPPTLPVTPTIITATAGGDALPTQPAITPILSTPIIATNAPTATATAVFTPTPFPRNLLPPTLAVQSRATVSVIAGFNNTRTDALRFEVGAGDFTFNGTTLGGSVRLFRANPVDPTSFVRTDSNGFLTFRPIGGGETAINSSPFYEGFTIDSEEENKNRVVDLAWSPDGRQFSFVIDPLQRPGQDYQNAGVWYWSQDTGRAFPVLRDCPADFYTSCDLILNRPAAHWRSLKVTWSPDSTRALVTLELPDEGRQALAIAPALPGEAVANSAPPFLRWDNGQWLDDGRLLVSGRNPDGRSQIAVYNTQTRTIERIIVDATMQGMFIADAVQRPDGQVIALGAPDASQPYRLYRAATGSLTPVSAAIGDRPPERIAWSGNYGDVALTIDGVQYLVNTSSGVVNQPVTGGAVQVGAELPDTPPQTGTILPPSGVVAGSRYDAGQQIQFIGEIPRNMRQQPALNAPLLDVVNPGEYVTVLAGPYEGDGFIWWDVANARSARGWISVRTLDGFAFFNP